MSDEKLRMRFQENACDVFWIPIKSEYPELSWLAVLEQTPFSLNSFVRNSIFSSCDSKKHVSKQI